MQHWVLKREKQCSMIYTRKTYSSDSEALAMAGGESTQESSSDDEQISAHLGNVCCFASTNTVIMPYK